MNELDMTTFKNKGLIYFIVSVVTNVQLGLICGFCYYLGTQAKTQAEVDGKLQMMKICAIIACILLAIGLLWLGLFGIIIGANIFSQF